MSAAIQFSAVRHLYPGPAETVSQHHFGVATGELSYRYAGLGQPVIQADVMQYWDAYRAVDSGGAFLGNLFRRTRDFDLGVTFSRPRVRTNAYLSVYGPSEAPAGPPPPAAGTVPGATGGSTAPLPASGRRRGTRGAVPESCRRARGG